MLDFTPLRQKMATMAELTAKLTMDDLRRLTNQMIDTMLGQLAGCQDADVIFVPSDPVATDAAAATSAEVDLPWTLGHVIVHVTASSEEAAFLAAEMARGVELHGRSRYETPWETIKTIEQCRARLEESRRMRLASLEIWPQQPHLDITGEYPWLNGAVDARGRFGVGLWHDDSHLNQINTIVQQAEAARAA